MKKNGFISKQLQKMIAPIIYEFMQVSHDILIELNECGSYDESQRLFNKLVKYEDYEKYFLEKLKEKGYDING